MIRLEGLVDGGAKGLRTLSGRFCALIRPLRAMWQKQIGETAIRAEVLRSSAR